MLIDYRASLEAKRMNEHLGVRVIPPHVFVTDPKTKVRVKDQSARSLLLRPGVQYVAPDRWAMVEKGAGCKRLVDGGQIRILPEDFNISRLLPFEALDVAKRTTDVDVLRAWIVQVEQAPRRPENTNLLEQLNTNVDICTTDPSGKRVEPRKLELIMLDEAV